MVLRTPPAIHSVIPTPIQINSQTNSPDAPIAFAYSPPVDAGLDMVYQDDYLLVLNKPSGLLTVPGRGAAHADCLISRVQREFPEALIVHRLDLDTSGLVIIARGSKMQSQLSKGFQLRQVDKRYVAVLAGLLASDSGSVDLPLIVDWPNRPKQKICYEEGRPSLTRYEVISRDPLANTTRVALYPETGRSHQLRVHSMSLGHAILGDTLYATAEGMAQADRLLLHAEYLQFKHPVSGETISLTKPAPF